MSSAWPGFDGEVNDEDLEELDLIDKKLEDAPMPKGGYTSPLMRKLGGKRLTIELLNTEIPKLRKAEEAAALLSKGVRGTKKRSELQIIITEGERSKERLFGAALPLIRTIANREHRRRQQWGSQVTLEDLTQEAIAGFFKGLAGFKPEALRHSATNYLGQWMLVEMRRAAEVMDHDFQVGHDAGERFRRVRALRSRLINDLRREPTDKEISDASRDASYVTRPGMVGKAPLAGEKPKIGKGLTVSQVGEERAARSRLGHASRFTDGDEEEGTPGLIDSSKTVSAWDSNDSLAQDPANLAIEADSARVIAAIVSKVITQMKMPAQQREIISRRFGLAPYSEEASAREISRSMGVHRERVTKVLNAFQQEMTRKGGTFHEVVSLIPEDDLIAVGLGWVSVTLGVWSGTSGAIANILIEKTTLPPTNVERATGSTLSSGILAWFQCDYHDRIFSGMYLTIKEVPKSRACPSCQKPSILIKTSA
jgi:RNA polymerase sigma factor (sigma-70 family)